jgi:hypothetical protein
MSRVNRSSVRRFIRSTKPHQPLDHNRRCRWGCRYGFGGRVLCAAARIIFDCDGAVEESKRSLVPTSVSEMLTTVAGPGQASDLPHIKGRAPIRLLHGVLLTNQSDGCFSDWLFVTFEVFLTPKYALVPRD